MDKTGIGVLRPRTLARLAAAVLTTTALTLGLTATAAGSATALQPTAAIQPTAIQPATMQVKTALSAPAFYERRVHILVNRRRAAHGLRPLRFAYCADASATRWARYLARNNQFYHQSMTDVLNRCDAQYAGETLGRGAMAPRKLVRMWMESPGHRAVLLSTKSTRLGIGAAPDAYGRWVVAANFIRP